MTNERYQELRVILEKMPEEEREGLVQYVESAKDYGNPEILDEDEIDLYEMITETREVQKNKEAELYIKEANYKVETEDFGFMEGYAASHYHTILKKQEAYTALRMGIKLNIISRVEDYHGSHEGDYAMETITNKNIDKFYQDKEKYPFSGGHYSGYEKHVYISPKYERVGVDIDKLYAYIKDKIPTVKKQAINDSEQKRKQGEKSYMEMRVLEMYVDKNSGEHLENGGKLANATVEMNELFIIENVSLMQGKNGMFVSMPSTKNSKGEYQNIAYFTNGEEREQLALALGKEFMKRTGVKIPQAEKIEVDLFLMERGSQKAYATVTVEEKMKITGIRVVHGKNGMFVSMPEAKDSIGGYHNVVKPSSKRAYEMIQEAVLREYEKMSYQKSKGEELKDIENDIEGSILSKKVTDLKIPENHVQEKSIHTPEKENVQDNVRDKEEKTQEKESYKKQSAPGIKR